MVDYLTKDRLRAAAGSLNQQTIVRKAQGRSPAGSTFLSHSSKDLEILPGVIAILEQHGAAVYVDKKDESLPPYTTRDTAALLRERIKQANKFILLTTRNSKDSRWMPWELGLADGYKGHARTAILPSVDMATDHSWAEQEYLGIYDRIVFGGLQNYSKDVFMVWNQQKHSAIELSRWLKG
jgi:hypothetical protein